MNFHDCGHDRIVDIEFFYRWKRRRAIRESGKANFKQSPAIIANLAPPFEPSCSTRATRYCFNRARRGSMEKKINGLTSSINKLSHAILYQILACKSARTIISDGIRNFVWGSNELDKFVRREKKKKRTSPCSLFPPRFRNNKILSLSLFIYVYKKFSNRAWRVR